MGLTAGLADSGQWMSQRKEAMNAQIPNRNTFQRLSGFSSIQHSFYRILVFWKVGSTYPIEYRFSAPLIGIGRGGLWFEGMLRLWKEGNGHTVRVG